MNARYFRDKVAIVTGGASGIGANLCCQLAAMGTRVIVADLDADAARLLAQTLPNAEARGVDVTDPAAVRQLVDEAASAQGRLDFMFNNAGTAIVGDFRDLEIRDMARVIDVNLKGVLYGSHAAYAIMTRQGHGHIINTASGFGLVPGPGNLPYVASKFGVVGLSESLRAEGVDLGVRVSVVCPGYVRTPLVEKTPTTNVEQQKLLESIPVKMVAPEEAARTILTALPRNPAIIAFPRYVGILAAVYRLLPGLFSRQAQGIIRRIRTFRTP